MSEPTREQIKEAFNKTIERWERIVEDPSYYYKSNCKLCGVDGEGQDCHKYCPIRSYGDHIICRNTPHNDFYRDNTAENALAELNFLRKVYIAWMEDEEKGEPLMDYLRKKEKKEEWVAVTDKITPALHQHSEGFYDIHFHLDSDPHNKGVGFMYTNGEVHFYNEDYKIERKGDSKLTFRILKKIVRPEPDDVIPF